MLQLFIFSAVTGHDRSVTTGKDQIISCTITGLSDKANVKWIDPDGSDISTSDTANYVVQDGKGSYTAGSQTTTLTLKKVVVEKITSFKTYQCSVSSSKYANSEAAVKNVKVTPIGGLIYVQIFKVKL